MNNDLGKHSIVTLPKWAQEYIGKLISMYIDEHERHLQTYMAYAILEDREWFTIPGPSFDDHEDTRTLFLLNRDGASAVCTLGRGDVLLIGRNLKKHEPRF